MHPFKTLMRTLAAAVLIVTFGLSLGLGCGSPLTIKPAGAEVGPTAKESVAETISFEKTQVQAAHEQIRHAMTACLAAESLCGLTDDEKSLLTRILRDEPVNPHLLFSNRNEEFLLQGETMPRSAKTGSEPGSPIVINESFLPSFDVWNATALLVHELGHHHSNWTHSRLDALGAKIKKLIQPRGTHYRTSDGRTQVIVFSAYNSNEQFKKTDPNHAAAYEPKVLVSHHEEIFDLTTELKQSLYPMDRLAIGMDCRASLPESSRWRESGTSADLSIHLTLFCKTLFRGTTFQLLTSARMRVQIDKNEKGRKAIKASFAPVNSQEDADIQAIILENKITPQGWRSILKLDLSFSPYTADQFIGCEAEIHNLKARPETAVFFKSCTLRRTSDTLLEVTIEHPLNPQSVKGRYFLREFSLLHAKPVRDPKNPEIIHESLQVSKNAFSEVYVDWEGADIFPLNVQENCRAGRDPGGFCFINSSSPYTLKLEKDISRFMLGTYTICMELRGAQWCMLKNLTPSTFHEVSLPNELIFNTESLPKDGRTYVLRDLFLLGPAFEVFKSPHTYKFRLSNPTQ